MPKLGPHVEEVELQLVFEDDGTLTLVAVVATGVHNGSEIVLARGIILESSAENMLNCSGKEDDDAAKS